MLTESEKHELHDLGIIVDNLREKLVCDATGNEVTDPVLGNMVKRNSELLSAAFRHYCHEVMKSDRKW